MLKRTLYDEEHEIFRKTVRAWAERNVYPHSDSWREAGCVSREVWKSAGAEGFLCMFADEKYGGLGLQDFRYDMVLAEEIGPREPGFFLGLHNRIVGPYLQHAASEAQRDRYMPGVVSGDTILAIAMTEPGTGSDLAGIATRAVEMEDHWVLNGSKTYISNGFLAGLVLVAARTNPAASHEIGLFLVEDGMEGFARGRNLKKLGLESQDTAELFFDNVKVPKENLLGAEGMGFIALMKELAWERMMIAIICSSAAEHALATTVEYVKQRQAFGKPVAAFQNTRFELAEMRSEIQIARVYVDSCMELVVKNSLSPEAACAAKYWVSDLLSKVVDRCVQLHGGYGYMLEYPIARAYIDTRANRIYGGTNEIMKELISRSI